MTRQFSDIFANLEREIDAIGKAAIQAAYDRGVADGERNQRAQSTGRSVGMLKPICFKCKRFFRMHKSGFYFQEGMPIGDGDGGQTWGPYKLWCGDVWRCPGCGADLIAGTGAHPIAEHYQKDYADQVERVNANYRVDDC